MTIILNGTTGITTPDITSSGSLNIDASAPDNSLVVTSAGSVGIGTSSPSAKLHINDSTGSAVTLLKMQTGWDNPSGQKSLVWSDNTNDLGRISVSYSAPEAKMTFGSLYNSGYQSSDLMTLTAAGDLLVGTTSSFGSGVGFCGFANGNAALRLKRGADYGATARFYNFGGSEVGSITVNASSTSYVTSSDYRLKEDWVAVADASTRVNALKPVNFAWIADGSRVDGFLAHELAEVVPEAVTGEKDAVELVDIKDEEGNVTGQEERPVYQGIDQSKLVPLLTAALQEALAQIESLTARVSALEAANV